MFRLLITPFDAADFYAMPFAIFRHLIFSSYADADATAAIYLPLLIDAFDFLRHYFRRHYFFADAAFRFADYAISPPCFLLLMPLEFIR